MARPYYPGEKIFLQECSFDFKKKQQVEGICDFNHATSKLTIYNPYNQTIKPLPN